MILHKEVVKRLRGRIYRNHQPYIRSLGSFRSPKPRKQDMRVWVRIYFLFFWFS